MSLVAHQARAYPFFRSMKRLGVLFSTPPGWMPVHRRVNPSSKICRYPFIHLGGERHYGSKVSCPRTQHNDPARAQTWTSRSLTIYLFIYLFIVFGALTYMKTSKNTKYFSLSLMFVPHFCSVESNADFCVCMQSFEGG